MTINSSWLDATFADDQNVELEYLFVYIGPVPNTMGNPYAPDVRLQVTISPPMFKLERWSDGTNFTHAFSYAARTSISWMSN